MIALSPSARRKLRRGAFLVLALLAPLVVLFAAHAWDSRAAALEFVSGTVAGPDGRTHGVTLPYTNEHEPQAAKYHYELDFLARSTPRPLLRIIPDDCVRSLAINGTPFPIASINATKLCDYRSGFDIDVARFWRPGKNHVTVDVENTSGIHGLALYSIRDGDPVSVLSVVLLVFLVLSSFFGFRLIVLSGALSLTFVEQWLAAALVGLGIWLRYHFVFAWHPPESYVFSDMSGYVDRAHQLVLGRGRGDENQAFQPLGYSMLLALSLRLAGDFTLADWAHVLLGTATVLLVWRASARWLRGPANLWVLAICALHVPFITLSGFYLAETVFAFQLGLLLYCIARFPFPWSVGSAFVIGFVYMSALWFKGNNTFFGPLVVGWTALWVLLHRREEWQTRARQVLLPLIAFCAAAAIVVASHAIFTYERYGHAHLSASTSALNLVEGKCPWKRNSDSVGYAWQSPLFVQLNENDERHWPRPFTDEKFFWAQGLDCIKRDPSVLWTSFRYDYYLFFDNQLWPPNATRYAPIVRAYGMFYSALLFPGILLAVVVIARRPRRKIALASLIGLSILICSWLFKSELRYRVPFDVLFVPLAVLGWSWAIARMPKRVKRVERVVDDQAPLYARPSPPGPLSHEGRGGGEKEAPSPLVGEGEVGTARDAGG